MKFGVCVFFAFWLISCPLFSQFTDDFSDGNLNGWEGDVSHFIVNANQQLQLNAPEGSTTSWIYTPVTFTDSMVWEMDIQLNFAPSTSNQLKIYLGVNQSDLTTASGYFLEIGASGDQDPLELKYLNNGSPQLLASSAPALVGSEPVEITIRIARKSNGLWECYKFGEVVPELLFSTTHDLIPLTSLNTFGYFCRYTDTRRDKFIFDNISINPILPDTTAPLCLSLAVTASNEVKLTFDELLDENTVQQSANYSLSPGIPTPNQIILNLHEITLRWAQPFTSQQQYSLTIRDIQDLAGNVMAEVVKVFTYIQIDHAMPFDLLITEMMVDPTPVVGLPDAEYVEILNKSGNVFNLSDYVLRIGTSERTLPDELIHENEYVIICGSENAALLSAYGRTVGLSSMPTLSNTGSSVTIKDAAGVIIHEVNYTMDWYRDAVKQNGGWSLEMNNPLYRCSDRENWSAANNLLGGTPGNVNSQWTMTPDLEGPDFLSLFTSGADKIELRFSESLDALLMENPSAYSIIPQIDISGVVLIDAHTVELTLAQPLQPEVVYQLLPFDAYDCLGNLKTHTDTIRFGLVSAPEAGDILINEILFNPATGGSRFIEIINASQKFINLNSLAIARITSINNNIYPTGINEIIGPGELAVFTPEPSDILLRYQVPQPSRLFDATLPSWDDKSDHAAIIAGGIMIDSFTYNSNWHHPVLADQNGVSLERVSLTPPTSSAFTWHSASSASGYATPTGENSQNITIPVAGESPFILTHKQFSPNEDGYKDFLALNFQSDSQDQVGSVWVYDLEGREIIRLLSNELLGSETIVTWDGRNESGVQADMGIYLLYIQLWDVVGNVKEYKETCALVKR